MSVVVVSFVSDDKIKKEFSKQKMHYSTSLVEVAVSGEVANPGVFEVAPGTSVKEVLALARLTPNSDRKKINFKKKILRPASIDVPLKEKRKTKKCLEKESSSSEKARKRVYANF